VFREEGVMITCEWEIYEYWDETRINFYTPKMEIRHDTWFIKVECDELVVGINEDTMGDDYETGG
jgi:hypothetical protein